jgi:hypothetical protein
MAFGTTLPPLSSVREGSRQAGRLGRKEGRKEEGGREAYSKFEPSRVIGF